MSACTFVKSAINDENPINTQESLKAIREDVEIIDSSLTFTHDLLRSMLDMHRAASHNLLVHESPLDVARDILEPVVSMLYQRNVGFDILTECPEGLFVVSDRLRLKQILLNLCRNSARYVQKGYIKIGANVVNGHIQFFVEDSGQGISRKGRKHLFSRFQESLEVMDQGSGVGLCLCKSMALLLNGDLWLDDSFDSGIEGYPGSRFVIGLNKGPIPDDEVKKILDNLDDQPEQVTLSIHEETNSNGGNTSDFSKDTSAPIEEQMPLITKKSVTVDLPPLPNGNIPPPPPSKHLEEGGTTLDLPTELSVLFVDDDMILRKLFVRSVRKVMSTWDIQEAASGEAALRLIDTKEFDIIFMDQYMASVEKKLLGTETVHAMRSKGVRSRICGLSANDVEEGFLSNGADAFMFKPFPCKKEQLERELHHLLHISRHSQHAGMTTSYNVSDDVSTRRPEGLDGSRENSDNTANMVVNA
jgi:CheY-like chemotaxis protein